MTGGGYVRTMPSEPGVHRVGRSSILVLVFAVAPALIRTSIIGARREAAGRIRTTRERIFAFLESFVITATAITAGIVTCGMVAFTALFVGCSVAIAFETEAQLAENIFKVFMFASPVIGLLVAGLIYWVTWPKR